MSITVDELRDVADRAEAAAASGDPMRMAFLLGAVAQWASAAATAAEQAEDADDGALRSAGDGEVIGMERAA